MNTSTKQADALPEGAVGQSVIPLESDEKLTGQAQYIADMYRPGMLHGALLQSPHAHALIEGYDLSAAQALPGVRAIVTRHGLGPGPPYGRLH